MTSFLTSMTKRKKSPEQLVTLAKQSLETLISNHLEDPVSSDTLAKCLLDLKNILYGDIESPEISEDKVREVSLCVQSENLILVLIENIEHIAFEARKDCALIFNSLIRKNIGDFVPYISNNYVIVENLINGYTKADAAINCGSMLRECVRHEALAKAILNSEQFWLFFDDFVHLPNFDIASDAFNTLKELLTTPKSKNVSSEFLEQHHEIFFAKYEILLRSENYVTRRRSLKLLSELLLERSNYNLMMRYISSTANLKTIMNLLRHKSSHIQFETFHVFKIFVANPKKTKEIETILYANKVKLIAYLEKFHLDKNDPQFVDEKRLLIDTLSTLSRYSPKGENTEKMVFDDRLSDKDEGERVSEGSLNSEHKTKIPLNAEETKKTENLEPSEKGEPFVKENGKNESVEKNWIIRKK